MSAPRVKRPPSQGTMAAGVLRNHGKRDPLDIHAMYDNVTTGNGIDRANAYGSVRITFLCVSLLGV